MSDDPGWRNWKRTNYAMHPWTHEIHRMGDHCPCDRHGGPAKKVTPSQALGLLDGTNLVTPGDCVKVSRLMMLAHEDEE